MNSHLSPSTNETPSAHALERSQRRAAFEAEMDAMQCSACWHEANRGPVTDDCARCKRCDWTGSGSYLHLCVTGWREQVCARCNEAAKDTHDKVAPPPVPSEWMASQPKGIYPTEPETTGSGVNLGSDSKIVLEAIGTLMQSPIQKQRGHHVPATLDEVLTAYGEASDGTFDAATLADFIARHPQFRNELNRYAYIQLSSVRATQEEIDAASHEDDISRLADQLESDAEWLREDHPAVAHEMGNSLAIAAATIRSLCKQLDDARGVTPTASAYRFLTPEDTIREGDEFVNDDFQTWGQAFGFMLGMRYATSMKTMRRRTDGDKHG